MTSTAERTAPFEQDLESSAEAVPVAEPPSREAVLLHILRDCQIEANRYLDEVRVQFGGE